MGDVRVVLADSLEGKSKEEILAALDEEVLRFSHYMANLEDPRARGALNNPEKALVKTYLVSKIREKL